MAPLFVSAAAEGVRFAGYVLRPRDNRLIGPDDAEVDALRRPSQQPSLRRWHPGKRPAGKLGRFRSRRRSR